MQEGLAGGVAGPRAPRRLLRVLSRGKGPAATQSHSRVAFVASKATPPTLGGGARAGRALGLAFRIPFQSSGIKTWSWFCARFLGPETGPRKWARQPFQRKSPPLRPHGRPTFWAGIRARFFLENRGSQVSLAAAGFGGAPTPSGPSLCTAALPPGLGPLTAKFGDQSFLEPVAVGCRIHVPVCPRRSSPCVLIVFLCHNVVASVAGPFAGDLHNTSSQNGDDTEATRL